MQGLSNTNTDLLCLSFIFPSWCKNLDGSTHLPSDPYIHLFNYLSNYFHLKPQFSKASCVKVWDVIHQCGTDVCSVCSIARWFAPCNQEKRYAQVLMSPAGKVQQLLSDSYLTAELGFNSPQPHDWGCTGASATLSALELACLWHSTGLNHMKLLCFECQKQPKYHLWLNLIYPKF